MRYYTRFTKIIACIITFLMLSQMTAEMAFALGEGPTQPEATQFEPVDGTDLVSLSTGDFVYTLPLMEVPGSEGGFPISMSYHSGVGTNTEATWVGLGWSLNPGAINRTISGYPDDYCGDKVQTHYWAKTKKGWGVSLGLGWGPVGMNMSFDNHGNCTGVNATVGIEIKGTPLSLGGSVGTSGVSFGPSLGGELGKGIRGSVGYSVGTQGSGITGGLSYSSAGNRTEAQNKQMPPPSIPLTGFSLASAGGARFSIMGGSAGSMSTSNGGKLTTFGFSIPIPLPGGFWASLGFSKYKYRLNENFVEDGYGYIHQKAYHETDTSVAVKKYERHVEDKNIYSSQDIYSVSGQGINGMFMPFAKEPYFLWDGNDSEYKAQLKNSNTYLPWPDGNNYDPDFGSYAQNNEIIFRFLGDEGTNFCNQDIESISWTPRYNNIDAANRYGSKRIIPQIDDSTGKIQGFIVIDADGKRYEYMQPVLNMYQFSRTSDAEYAGDEERYITYNSMPVPYATSWYVTAIKGPDYVDRGTAGTDQSDWGYWVKFTYNYSSEPQVWRSPFTGVGPGSTDTNMTNFAFGVREIVYLHTIESNSHVAFFKSSIAQDRMTAVENEDVEFDASKKIFGNPLKYRFAGNWKPLLDAAGGDIDSIFEIHLKYLRSDGVPAYQTNFLSKQNINYQYIQSENVTEVTDNLSTTSIEINQQTYTLRGRKYIRKAKFNVGRFYQTNKTLARRLDFIDLYSKTDPGLSEQNGKWTVNDNVATTIKSVQLGYNYGLCPNTPSSSAWGQGKLSLTSVRFLGKERSAYMPAYSFSYETFNPGYDEHNWDNWGSYREPAAGNSDYGLNRHTTPQDSARASKVVAWQLKTITTPTGGTISAVYESDDYYWVSDYIDVDKFSTYYTISKVTGYNNKLTCSDQNVLNMNLKVGEYVCLKRKVSYTGVGCHPNPNPAYYYDVKTITQISQNGSSATITLDSDFDWLEDIYGCTENYEYKFSIYPRKIYGGGLRVKSVTTSDGVNSYKSIYKYEKDGFSTGVTATLPAMYKTYPKWMEDELNSSDNEKFEKIVGEHGLSYGRPSPGVIYSQVEVTNVDGNNNSINGKTVFEFYTAKDFPYNPIETKINNDLYYYKVDISDKSGIYGKPKTIKQYEAYNGNQLRCISIDSTSYAFSTGLTNAGKVVNKSGTNFNNTYPLGLIQEKYLSRNKWGSDQSDHKRTFVNRIYENIFTWAKSIKTFSYNDTLSGIPSDSIEGLTRSFIWDATSGSVTATAIYGSDGLAVATKRTPAFYVYTGMENRNMLTQNASEMVYKTNVTDRWGSNLINYTFNADDLLTGSVTTWSNHWSIGGLTADSAWRQNDQFTYNKQKDRASGSAFSAFTDWTYTSAAYPAVTANFPWKMVSNILQYDQFSHPIEEIGIDAVYTAALYGYNRALPVAIVNNAPYGSHTDGWPRGFSYCGFENIADNKFDGGWSYINEFTKEAAFTGEASAKVTSTINRFGPTLDFKISEGLRNNTKYIISCWVKTTSPSFVLNANKNNTTNYMSKSINDYIAQVGDWKLIQMEYTYINNWSGTDFLRVYPDNNNTIPAYVDDIRVYPADATMSTFTYDPWTQKVTSITDANNVTSYFEYDAGGRLVKVYDQDKNLIKKYTYQYK